MNEEAKPLELINALERAIYEKHRYTFAGIGTPCISFAADGVSIAYSDPEHLYVNVDTLFSALRQSFAE